MKMTNDTKDDLALGALFESARSKTPALTPDFLARLQADAKDAIAQQPNRTETPTPGDGIWSQILSTLFPVSGLAAATLAGVWIGFQEPTANFAAGFSTGDSADFDVSVFLPAVALSGFTEVEADG